MYDASDLESTLEGNGASDLESTLEENSESACRPADCQESQWPRWKRAVFTSGLILTITGFLLPVCIRKRVAPNASAKAGVVSLVQTAADVPQRRFCGIAITEMANNGWDRIQLLEAVAAGGHGNVWFYDWSDQSAVQFPMGAVFRPMIHMPTGGDMLSSAGKDGNGHMLLGWNEPDEKTQMGQYKVIREQPEVCARQWVLDMRRAKSLGYTEFASPAIAHNTCWLDHFLHACEKLEGCPALVTYLTFHLYHIDCATYHADPKNAGWRYDLGYILSMFRLMQKYNQRGFQIKGLLLTEFGCLTAESNWRDGASMDLNLQYMQAFYHDTVINVMNGEGQAIAKIMSSPETAGIAANGPDAVSGVKYVPAQCKPQAPDPEVRKDIVKAIQSLNGMAWFSVSPGLNYLFDDSSSDGLSRLGKLYFSSCKSLKPQSVTQDQAGHEVPRDDISDGNLWHRDVASTDSSDGSSDPGSGSGGIDVSGVDDSSGGVGWDNEGKSSGGAGDGSGEGDAYVGDASGDDNGEFDVPCKDARQGDECFKNVIWAQKHGFPQHPEWYPELNPQSSFKEFQAHLAHQDFQARARLAHVQLDPSFGKGFHAESGSGCSRPCD